MKLIVAAFGVDDCTGCGRDHEQVPFQSRTTFICPESGNPVSAIACEVDLTNKSYVVGGKVTYAQSGGQNAE